MNEFKHTPGPWEIRLRNKYTGDFFEIRPCFGVHGHTSAYTPIAIVRGDRRLVSEEQMAVNARLIASAPELLEALQRIVGGLPCYSEGSYYTDHHRGDGEYLGQEIHDPKDIIDSIMGIALSAIEKVTGDL